MCPVQERKRERNQEEKREVITKRRTQDKLRRLSCLDCFAVYFFSFSSHPSKTIFSVVDPDMGQEQKKARMDKLLLPLIEALRHCHKLEFFMFGDDDEHNQQVPDPCTMAPAFAMVENVLEGFWPNYSQPPRLPVCVSTEERAASQWQAKESKASKTTSLC